MEFKRSLVNTEAQLSRLLEKLDAAPVVGFDSESNGPLLVGLRGKKSMVNVYRSRLAGVSLAFLDGTSYYVPLEHREANLPSFHQGRLSDALGRHTGRVWAHSLKHEMKALDRWEPWHGLDAVRASMQPWRCTQVGCWLVGADSGVDKHPFGIKYLAPRYLGVDMGTFDDTTGGHDFGQLHPKDGLAYACEDAEAALRLGEEVVRPRLAEQSLGEWYESVETPFVGLLRRMEDAGMALDRERHAETMQAFRARQAELADEWTWLHDGSITSPPQLAKLYESGVWDPTGVPRTKTGHSTEAEYVRWQLDRCPPGSKGHRLAAIKTEHAQYTKLVSTYGDKLVAIADQYPDGRLHGSFHQTGTETGRLSSSYPNLQNIPKRTDLGKRVRESFVASPGCVLLSADYSQIELRVMAHFAGSGRLFDGYRRGADVHAETAAMASELLGMTITRDQGKTGNFAPIYGAGPKKLARALGVSAENAKRFLEAHAEIHSEAHAVLRRARDAAEKRGYVRTIAGRRRQTPVAAARQALEALRARGERYQTSERFRDAWLALGREERIAQNTPIQGSAADIVKVGMLAADRALGGGMVCQIHDDVVFEVDEKRAEAAARDLSHALCDVGPELGLRVPLVAEPSWGYRWSDL